MSCSVSISFCTQSIFRSGWMRSITLFYLHWEVFFHTTSFTGIACSGSVWHLEIKVKVRTAKRHIYVEILLNIESLMKRHSIKWLKTFCLSVRYQQIEQVTFCTINTMQLWSTEDVVQIRIFSSRKTSKLMMYMCWEQIHIALKLLYGIFGNQFSSSTSYPPTSCGVHIIYTRKHPKILSSSLHSVTSMKMSDRKSHYWPVHIWFSFCSPCTRNTL